MVAPQIDSQQNPLAENPGCRATVFFVIVGGILFGLARDFLKTLITPGPPANAAETAAIYIYSYVGIGLIVALVANWITPSGSKTERIHQLAYCLICWPIVLMVMIAGFIAYPPHKGLRTCPFCKHEIDVEAAAEDDYICPFCGQSPF